MEGQNYNVENNAYQVQPKPAKNTVGLVGFILSLVSLLCCGILSIVSLILSIVGLNKAKELGGVGKGLSLAGLIISIVSIVFGLIAVPLFMPKLISSVNDTWSEQLNTTIVYNWSNGNSGTY